MGFLLRRRRHDRDFCHQKRWLAQILTIMQAGQAAPLAKNNIDILGIGKDSVGPYESWIGRNQLKSTIRVAAEYGVVIRCRGVDAVPRICGKPVRSTLFAFIHNELSELIRADREIGQLRRWQTIKTATGQRGIIE